MKKFEKKLIDPPSVYRPVPFWSWNDKLETDETRRQIRLMKEAGFGGFFMHARGGLQTEYLSEEWFDNVSASIDEGEKCDMSAWGYDENGWPSGSGNGSVTALGADYQQKYLRCEKTDSIIENSNTISNVKADDCVYHCYFELNSYYIDTLNPRVISEFLKSTHQKYRENLKEDFKKMKGFFTDEPETSRNGIPWSFNLEKEYKRIYKDDIKKHLPKLFYRLEGFEQFRFRFWKLVRDLFTDSFMGVIGNWCRENGAGLTGHMVLEENFYEQILANGCCMPSYEFMDIPGMDHIDRKFPSIQTEMQLVSVAHQLGKKQILTETFAACGWNISFEDMRRIYEHQMVHGVNLLCQHLEGYSLRGIRKRDYPASIFIQQPWWKEYKAFNDMVSRIGMLLAEGQVCYNILVLNTIESGWLLIDDRAGADAYAKKLRDVMKSLENSNIYYHLGESRIISRYGRIKNGEFLIGEQKYKAVIIPDSNCLDNDVFDLLCEFKNQGGTVIFSNEIPGYLNGVKTQKVSDFAKNCIIADSESIPRMILKDCCPVSVFPENPLKRESIRSTFRRFKDEEMTMCYICNFDCVENSVNIKTVGKSAALFDAAEGKILPAVYKTTGETIDIKCNIPSDSSVVVFIYDKKEQKPAKPTCSKKTDISGKLKGEWNISKIDNNSLTLDYCELTVNGKTICENMPVSDVQETLCSYGKAVNAKLTFRFNIRDVSFNKCMLMLETPEIFDIAVNNLPVDKSIIAFEHDKSFKLLDIRSFVRPGENTVTLSCVFEQSAKTYQNLEQIKSFLPNRNRFSYDMEIEAIYLKGDFGVFSQKGFEHIERNAVKTIGEFYLDKAPKTVVDGSLELQGYPFFAGTVALKKQITLSEGEAQNAVISFEKLPSTVCEIRVNGHMAGKIMWKPYCVDISHFSRKGENNIEIILTGSLRNLLGPFHLKEGESYCALPFYFFKKTGIWGWGDGENKKWTDDYSFVKNGLFF